MFRTTHTIKQASAGLALAATIAALSVPTALAGGSGGQYRDGWYGYAVAQTKQQHPQLIDGRSPDTRDAAAAALLADSRFGARDGWYGYAVAQTKQQHPQLIDGRSPDTRDAAAAASLADSRFGAPDGWYGYAVSLTKQPHPTPIDGRSPDTTDAAIQAHAPILTVYRSAGFAWGDFGIGIGAALGLVLLVAASVKMLTARNRRPGPVATA